MACNRSGSNFTGYLISIQTGFTPPEATISVGGANPVDANIEFDKDAAGSSPLPFRVDGLENQEVYLFRVSHSTIDSIVSFPFMMGGPFELQLAAIPTGTVAHIGEQAVANNLIPSVNQTLGIVMGQLNLTGQGGCRSIRTISLLDSSGGTTAGTSPTIYFDDAGNFRTNGISDNKCSYIIFNLSPGTYQAQYLSDAFSLVAQQDIVVFPGETSFGLAVP